MADLLRRVGKMLAMRPMTIIPLRRGPPPFTIALVRMFQMNKQRRPGSEQFNVRVRKLKVKAQNFKIRKKTFSVSLKELWVEL